MSIITLDDLLERVEDYNPEELENQTISCRTFKEKEILVDIKENAIDKVKKLAINPATNFKRNY